MSFLVALNTVETYGFSFWVAWSFTLYLDKRLNLKAGVDTYASVAQSLFSLHCLLVLTCVEHPQM